MYFTSYELLRRALQTNQEELSAVEVLLAGGLAGVAFW